MAYGEQYLRFLPRSWNTDYGNRYPYFLGVYSLLKLGWREPALAVIMTLGTLSFLVTTPPKCGFPIWEVGEHGFPLLTGAGRLVIKDTAILAGALVVLADSAKKGLEPVREIRL